MARNADPALLALDTVELRDRLARGALRAVDLAEACLARVAKHEGEVRAWAWMDPDHVRARARSMDARRQSGAAVGPLHGLPVGLKDIIDTRGIPTENGTPIDRGRVPDRDATVVHRLRAAGALLLGKTVTTECAFLHPGPTRNPWNLGHTPGGSSSGSAAAVAAGMVPLAIGTQTGGSVIRPASYCGVVGYKPSFGMISRQGILPQSPSLDTVGVFAQSVGGAALLAQALAGHDPADPATEAVPVPPLLDIALQAPPVQPTFAVVELPGSDDADGEVRQALDELAEALGDQAFRTGLPDIFAEAAAQRELVNLAEMSKCYYAHERRGRSLMSPELTSAMDRGKAVLARDYLAALDWPGVLNAGLEQIFQRCDAILCAAAPSPAPVGFASTGSSIFNGLWTFCGTPAVTIPLFRHSTGLPMGLQLVGPRGQDGRLLRVANWLGGRFGLQGGLAR
jgi:Asp-tRNA(Asn)/Glu-tRNA(Gln) amidotransferase A subunit family amidase